MPNRYAWIALGVGAYIAFVLSSIPAAATYRWLAPPELRLSGIEGTLWSGRAALASAGGLPMRDVRWRIDALPLLTGRIAGRAEAALTDGFFESNVEASVGGTVVLSDVRMSAPLAALAPALPLGGVRGQIAATLDRIVLRDGWPVEVLGQVRLARLAAPTFVPGGRGSPIPLGDYELVFDERPGDEIGARFRDTGGPLETAGTLTLEAGGQYRIEAVAAPRGDAPPELTQALDLMAGPPGPDGKRPFELAGSL